MGNPSNHATGMRVIFRTDQDVFCTKCGYNLRGTDGVVCPECGIPFQLAAENQREFYPLYLLALVCTSGLVFVSQYFVFVIIDAINDPIGVIDMYGLYEIVTYVINLIAIPYLVLLIMLRKLIVRSSVRAQLAWTIPAMIGAGAELIYSLYTVFVY